MSTRPSFGRRNAPRAASPILASPSAPVADEDAFFAEIRQEAGNQTNRSVFVPNSLFAAVMAGLAVGCGLAVLDIMGIGQTFRPLPELLAIDRNAAALLPFMILLGLIGGGRAAATTLLIAHMVLNRIGQTGRVAYTFGGAAAATAFAGAMFALMRQQPTHGWLIDCVAGGVAGFLYRAFAGIEHD